MFYLKGLSAEAGYQASETGERKSGAAWMYAGLSLALGNLESQLLYLKRV
jgi:hypothetical protein